MNEALIYLPFKCHLAGYMMMRQISSSMRTMARCMGFAALLVSGSVAAQASFNDALRDKAIENGAVRVIVALDVPFSPEGRLPDAAAQGRQRQQIATAQGRVLRALRGTAARLTAQYLTIPHLAFEVDASTLDVLSVLHDVVAIEEDVPVPAIMQSSNEVIGTEFAWLEGYTGAGQTVAILDTGVDKSHPFFANNKVVSEACYSTNSATYNSFSVCPDDSEASVATGSGIDCTAAAAGYPNAQNSCDHGTHVAGSAAGNDGQGPHFGVAKDANIIAIQIFSVFRDYCDGSDCLLTWSSDQILALERVFALRDAYSIAAVNMSIGGGGYNAPCDSDDLARKQAMDNLASVGIATVVAAGNDGHKSQLSSPACISTAISVGATNDSDDVAWFSNVAEFLDLFAPGVSITSSVPGGGTGTWNGTSMATPHVTGAWAVLKQADNTAPVDAVLEALTATGTPLDDNRTGGSVTGIPRVNVDLAVAALQPTGSILAFVSSSYTVGEGVGVVVLQVERSGSAAGAVSVAYTTADGSALANQDYADSSGTLHWADGDASVKEIQITIINDDTVENAFENFSVTLSNPTGTDVSFGDAVTSVVSIADDDMPAAPETPEILTVTNNTDGTATLRWSDVDGETGYAIEREKKNNRRWKNRQQVGTTGAGVLELTDQSGSGTFRWRVRAENDAGSSAWSDWLEATVTDSSDSDGDTKPCRGKRCR